VASPTTRSIAYLRDKGYEVDVVERWISFGGKGGIRKDFGGFADLIAYNADHTLAIQVTTKENVNARIKKVKGMETLDKWLSAHHRHFIVHGWAKRGERGKRKTWELDIHPILPNTI